MNVNNRFACPDNDYLVGATPRANKETLLYRQSFDGWWHLRAAGNAHIGTFASPAVIKQWCDENGYNCRQG